MTASAGCESGATAPVERPSRPEEARRAARVVHDRTTLFVYALVSVYGYFLYCFGPSTPLLRADEGTSRGVSALHSTALALGTVFAGAVGPRVVKRWGRTAVLRAGAVGLAAGTVVYTAAPILPVTLAGALLGGTAGAFVINMHSAVLSDHQGPAAGGAITEANGLAALVGLLAAATLGLAAAGPGWRWGILLTVPFALVVVSATRGTRFPTPAASAPAMAPGRLPPAYWAAWVAVVAFVATEFCLTFWASDLMRERTGLPAGAATATIAAILGGMALGRIAGSRLVLVLAPETALLGAIGVTLVGFAAFWTSRSAPLSVAALVVVGTGLALQFPVAIARALTASRGRPDVAVARASLGAGLAIGVAPFVLGSLADHVGTGTAFLLVPALLTVAAVAVRVQRLLPS